MKSILSNRSAIGVRVLGLALVASGGLLLATAVLAQGGGPTARAVRLSNVDGQVQVSQGGQVLAAQALANTPLFEGSEITTNEDGRAEIQFEDGSVARISPNSSLTLRVLRQQGTSTDTEVALNQGLGYFEIQGDSQANRMQVRFGDTSVTSSGFTVLRVDLDNPPGALAVFSGNAHVDSSNALALDIHGGESVKLNSAEPGNYVLSEAIEPDSWDAWNSDRDQALTAEEADRTAATSTQPNSNNPAWSDLDANGNWYNMPGQGYVWSPNEAESTGWDPYGCGSWMWTPGYGYIWVSCEPWGFMPYASGMWGFYDGLGWAWAPGGGYWWGGGGWGYNIGNAPYRYQPPNRPRGGPVHPGSGSGAIRTGGRYQPYAVVGVNRLHDGGASGTIRPHNGPVMIAGTAVQPLKPISTRPVYGNGFVANGQTKGSLARPGGGTGYGFVPGTGNNAGARYGYGLPNGGNTGATRAPSYYGSYGARPSEPSHGSYGGGTGARPSGGGSYSGGASHASSGGGSFSGGGGGGASHAGGSGGGGGGGAHH
jgi:hypothetical protein